MDIEVIQHVALLHEEKKKVFCLLALAFLETAYNNVLTRMHPKNMTF